MAEAAADAEEALTAPLPADVTGAEQWTFLGRGWTYGLALEAALKMREASGAWTEAYPAMEYRHGPIAVTGPGLDPLAALVHAQRLAVTVAESRGHDPDHPRNLTRSVILTPPGEASSPSGV